MTHWAMTHWAYDRRMKRVGALSAFGLAAVLWCAPLVHAQRGGGHAGGGARGGFSGGHAVPAFRSGGSYAARPAYGVRPGYASRPGYPGRPGMRVVARGSYGLGYSYGIGYPFGYGLGYYDPAFGYDDSANYDTTGPPAGPYVDPNAGMYADPSVGPYAPEAGPVAPPAYRAAPAPVYRAAQPAPEPEDAVTLIFKDGRPPLQIHNYALTRTTVYVTDAKHRDIPVADLDLPATVKANADAGVPFQLPGPN